jgi:cytochrome oxidase Cu insertion factor (SCO1/SenC/PrrC family)
MRPWTRTTLCVAAVAAAAVAAVGVSMAQDATRGAEADKASPVNLAAGAKAPDFRLNDHTGQAVRLSAELEGKWVVLAFFPKAMTPG